jgi:glutathione-specific gamma-glutamylcyclotransferase
MSLPASLPLDADGDLYVFAYGSLIWRPGFAYSAMHPALLRGYHRRFCIWSRQYRGTPESPGLVLGLDRGGACRGVAFQVRAAEAAAVLDYLQDREMPPSEEAVYERRILRVSLLDSGREVRAVAFVADRTRDSYCRPEAAAAAAAISRGSGRMGPNREYLLNTVAHLRAMGVRDSGLDRIAALLPPPA